MIESGRIQEWNYIRKIDPVTHEIDHKGLAFGTVRANGENRYVLGTVEYKGMERVFTKQHEGTSREVARGTMLEALARLTMNTVSRENPKGILGVVCTFKTRNPWLKALLIDDEEVGALAQEHKEKHA